MRSGRQLAIIASALDELPPHYREAFLLQVVCGWPFEAVGREMRISERMAGIYTSRAFMRVQRELDASASTGEL